MSSKPSYIYPIPLEEKEQLLRSIREHEWQSISIAKHIADNPEHHANYNKALDCVLDDMRFLTHKLLKR